jgi:hypothetical protein
VSDLAKAGLSPLAQYAWIGETSSTGQSSFASGNPKPTSAHPMSLGGQVDDGPYRILNADSVRIGRVTFHYRILGGDTLKPPVPHRGGGWQQRR